MSEGHLIQWLSHVDLESVALNSTKELLDSLDKLRHGIISFNFVLISSIRKICLFIIHSCFLCEHNFVMFTAHCGNNSKDDVMVSFPDVVHKINIYYLPNLPYSK